MAKKDLFFVGKLGNSSLLPAFSALIRPFLSHFPFVAVLCKGLKLLLKPAIRTIAGLSFTALS